MTREQFEAIWGEEDDEDFYQKHDWKCDNAFQGLQIIAKYYDTSKEDIIEGATHDEVYSVSIDDLLQRGVTEEDIRQLIKLNWHIDRHSGCFACFV